MECRRVPVDFGAVVSSTAGPAECKHCGVALHGAVAFAPARRMLVSVPLRKLRPLHCERAKPPLIRALEFMHFVHYIFFLSQFTTPQPFSYFASITSSTWINYCGGLRCDWGTPGLFLSVTASPHSTSAPFPVYTTPASASLQTQPETTPTAAEYNQSQVSSFLMTPAAHEDMSHVDDATAQTAGRDSILEDPRPPQLLPDISSSSQGISLLSQTSLSPQKAREARTRQAERAWIPPRRESNSAGGARAECLNGEDWYTELTRAPTLCNAFTESTAGLARAPQHRMCKASFPATTKGGAGSIKPESSALKFQGVIKMRTQKKQAVTRPISFSEHKSALIPESLGNLEIQEFLLELEAEQTWIPAVRRAQGKHAANVSQRAQQNAAQQGIARNVVPFIASGTNEKFFAAQSRARTAPLATVGAQEARRLHVVDVRTVGAKDKRAQVHRVEHANKERSLKYGRLRSIIRRSQKQGDPHERESISFRTRLKRKTRLSSMKHAVHQYGRQQGTSSPVALAAAMSLAVAVFGAAAYVVRAAHVNLQEQLREAIRHHSILEQELEQQRQQQLTPQREAPVKKGREPRTPEDLHTAESPAARRAEIFDRSLSVFVALLLSTITTLLSLPTNLAVAIVRYYPVFMESTAMQMVRSVGAAVVERPRRVISLLYERGLSIFNAGANFLRTVAALRLNLQLVGRVVLGALASVVLLLWHSVYYALNIVSMALRSVGEELFAGLARLRELRWRWQAMVAGFSALVITCVMLTDVALYYGSMVGLFLAVTLLLRSLISRVGKRLPWPYGGGPLNDNGPAEPPASIRLGGGGGQATSSLSSPTLPTSSPGVQPVGQSGVQPGISATSQQQMGPGDTRDTQLHPSAPSGVPLSSSSPAAAPESLSSITSRDSTHSSGTLPSLKDIWSWALSTSTPSVPFPEVTSSQTSPSVVKSSQHLSGILAPSRSEEQALEEQKKKKAEEEKARQAAEKEQKEVKREALIRREMARLEEEHSKQAKEKKKDAPTKQTTFDPLKLRRE